MTIQNFLNILIKTNNKQINQCLVKSGEDFILKSQNKTLIKINENKILLYGNKNLSPKILIQNYIGQNTSKLKAFSNFTDKLGENIIRLNHLGISYFCNDFKKEAEHYKNNLEKLYSLFQEQAESNTQKWLFIGNTKNWQEPMFELVLNKPYGVKNNEWVPHFQIDIDTNLNPNNLTNILNKYFGERFVSWKLDIPNYGIVLFMGKIALINGTSIYLSIGTNLRNTKMHREQILKKY